MAATITPIAATTAHHRCATKVPISTRNSPTNPLRPGTPMEAIMATVNTPAMMGAGDCRPFRAETCQVLRRS
jgi:hypothetical protein